MTDSRLDEEMAKVLGDSTSGTPQSFVRDNMAKIEEWLQKKCKWPHIAKVAANIGIRDANGQEPSSSSLYQAWLREKRDRRVAPRTLRGRPPSEPTHPSKAFK
jgi:hypothetical protein